MKKPFLAILCLLNTLLCFGQDGLYIFPLIENGYSNIYSKTGSTAFSINESIYANSFQLNAGYRLGNATLSLGLGYLKTGYKINDYTQINSSKGLINTDIICRYDHFIIPIHVYYIFYLNDKLSLQPGGGFILLINTGEKIEFKGNDFSYKYVVNPVDFKSIYKPVSWMGTANLYFTYKTNEQVSFFAGPSFNYMLENIIKDDRPPHLNQHNYNIFFDIGCSVYLQHKNSITSPK